jgi:hypothetical protein
MFAKTHITLSIFGLLAILAACSGVPTVDLATSSPSTAVVDISSTPQSTAGTQTSLGFDCQNIQEIPVEECQALVALYESTDGDHWEDNSGWLVDQMPCSWYGVICQEGHVVDLQLYYNQLSGSLPPEIGNLPHLKRLHLDANQLNGPLPAEIGNLPELELARLGGNQFNSIPAEMAKLNNLIFLELWGNQLSGEIPGEFGNLSKLEQLNLRDNQFTGGIPPELGNLARLNQLNLSHNQLSRSIPVTLGDLRNLNELDLSHNQLTGSVPAEFGNLASLYWLDLSYNELTGTVPAALSNAPIAELRLWGNLLDGTILPSEEQITKVDYGGVHFEVNSALAESVWVETVSAIPPSAGGPGWDVRPEHLRFTIAGHKEQTDFQGMRVGFAAQPQIMIYPVQEFSTMSELARAEIETLQSLLETRPPASENEIPLLPLINAAQVFHTQVKYLDFQNGRGVRFITQYSQDVAPVTNQNIFYSFQGLTQDGAYYVAAYFPIAADGLSDELAIEDWEAFNAGYQDYLSETVSHLDALSSHEFEPDLALVDQVIQSLVVDTP